MKKRYHSGIVRKDESHYQFVNPKTTLPGVPTIGGQRIPGFADAYLPQTNAEEDAYRVAQAKGGNKAAWQYAKGLRKTRQDQFHKDFYGNGLVKLATKYAPPVRAGLNAVEAGANTFLDIFDDVGDTIFDDVHDANSQ